MAVVKMKKMLLLGLAAEKDKILHDIAFEGEVELSDPSALLEQGQGTLSREGADRRLSAIEAKLSVLEQAIGILSPLAPAKKKKLFAPKDGYTKAQFEQMQADHEDVLARATQAVHITEQIRSIESYTETLRLAKAALEPWKNYDMPLSETETKYTQTVFFTSGAGFNAEELDYALCGIAATYEKVSEGEHAACYAAVCCKSDADKFFEALRDCGCAVVSLSGTGTPIEEGDGLSRQIAESENNISALRETVKNLACGTDEMKFCRDALAGEYAAIEARQKLASSQSAFMAQGYVPAENVEKIEKLLEKYTVSAEFEDPDPSVDDVPVKLKNNDLIEPYEMVTEMYDLPRYGELDPDTVMMPFFWLIAGMMFADLGYGIILTAVGFLLRYVVKIKGTFGKISGLMFQCGISTMIFGLLYGSFFGDAIAKGSFVFTGTEVNITPLLLDPMKDPLTLMIICIGVGLVHIMAGMGVQAYQLIKDGHPFAAIFDVGSWYLVFIGIVVLIAGSNVGMYMMIAGAAMLVLTQGREKKGFFGKLIGGLGSIYGVTGYLSDLLSYSRILALCLSGAVVAQVFNSIGSLLGHSIPGMILFTVVFLIGHVFNIAMNLLSVYVHTSRLQYIEFFGKFYRSGGRAFAPVRLKTKYVQLKEDK